MEASRRRRDEWAAGLQGFLASRLRTPPYAQALRAYPLLVGAPPIAHTQGLLDGLVWALNDHPAWDAETWLALQNHLRQCAERYAEVRGQLATASAPEGPLLHRERLYRAQAALQDVYVGFCVVDAARKSGGGADRELLRALTTALPSLVSEYVPVFAPQGSSWADAAAAEFRPRFLALLVAWTAPSGGLPAETHRRLEDHLRQRLHVDRAAGETATSPAQRAAVRGGLEALGGTVAASSTARPGGPAALRATAEAADRRLRSFLASIVPPRRGGTGRPRCSYCGALLRDEMAKTVHSRRHGRHHNVRRPEVKVVRLTYPTATAFVEHSGDVERTGYDTAVTEILEEAYKDGGKGAQRTRRLAAAPSETAPGT